jgi:hypothetical protein
LVCKEHVFEIHPHLLLPILFPNRHIHRSNLVDAHRARAQIVKADTNFNQISTLLVTTYLEWDSKSSKRALQPTHSPLGSLPVRKQLSVKGKALFNLLHRPPHALASFDRGSNFAFNLFGPTRKHCVGNKVKSVGCSGSKFFINGLGNAGVVPTSGCVDFGGDHIA